MQGRAPIWVLAFALFMGSYLCYDVIVMIISGPPYIIPGLGSDARPISQAHAPYAFAAMTAIRAIGGIGFVAAPLWQIASRMRVAFWAQDDAAQYKTDDWDG